MGNHKKRFYVTKPARLVIFQLSLISLITHFAMTHLKFFAYMTYMKVYERCENSS